MAIKIVARLKQFEFLDDIGEPITYPAAQGGNLDGIKLHLRIKGAEEIKNIQENFLAEAQVEVGDPFSHRAYRAGVYDVRLGVNLTDEHHTLIDAEYFCEIVELGYRVVG